MNKKSNKSLKGGLSARPGTLNTKCPNMDCGTSGLPGFHPVWSKVGGYREYLKMMKKKYSKKNNRISKSLSKINKSKTNKSKINKKSKFKKIGGKAKIGPYFALDNVYLPSYSRYGAPGNTKNWKGGINLN